MTGTFDNWSRSIELDKDSGIFQRQVDIPSTKSNIHYKFIVDGTWTTDSSAPTEKDESGNTNNFLKPSDISPLPAGARSSHGQHPTPNPTAAVISGIVPGSSTAQMAGQVPLEGSKDGAHDSEMPGAFPAESPAKEKEPEEFSVKPIPASSGIHNPIQLAPGDIVPDYGNSSSMAAVKDDAGLKKGDKAFGISPLPATSGTGNPIQTKPGEKLPSSETYTSNSVQSHVKTNKASYEKSDDYPTSSSGNDARQAFPSGAFGVPPVSHNSIPESSLPMNPSSTMDKDGGPTIQSAGAGTSTAAMAGQVPLEPRGVPEVVRESQLEANQSPEASSSKAAVADKDAVEEELKKKVPEEPSASENSTVKTGAAAAAAGAAGLAGGAAAVAAGVPQSITSKISSMTSGSKVEPQPGETAPGVPEQVSEAQAQSSTSPEASANPESVANKKKMEAELESKITTANDSGEPAPPYSASESSKAAASRGSAFANDPTIADENTMPAIAVANNSGAGQQDTQAFRGDPTEAGLGGAGTSTSKNDSAVATGASESSKQQVGIDKNVIAFNGDDSVSSDQHQDSSTAQSGGAGGLNAPASDPAKSAATADKETKEAQTADTKKKAAVEDSSRDISPMSKPSQPVVTTGTSSANTPTKSDASGADSPTDKKSKRRSLFGKIKEKLKH